MRTFVLHQIRDGVDIMHMRVHPRNLKACVPHMATAGFLPTSVADEWVDGQRFVTMFLDIGSYCDDPEKMSALQLSEAVRVAWSLYMEEYPGRASNQEKSRSFAEDLHRLIKARIQAWDRVELLLARAAHFDSIADELSECLVAPHLEVKAERRADVEALLDQHTNWTEEGLEALQTALILALNSRESLERDLAMLETYLEPED